VIVSPSAPAAIRPVPSIAMRHNPDVGAAVLAHHRAMGNESTEKGKRSSTSIWMAVALVAITVTIGLAAVAGFLLGHFTGGTSSATATEETAATPSSEPGAEVFVASGCGNCHTFAAAGTTGTTGPNLNEYLAPDDTAAGIEEMIVAPEAEIAEGYSGGIMPTTYGQSLSEEELGQLVQFLVANSPAEGNEEGAAGGEPE
jgi:mono/diheme cytochrome c family protein